MGQGSPAQGQEYYWCRKGAQVGGASVQYVTRLVPAHGPSTPLIQGEAVGKAWVRYILKTYSPEDKETILQTSWNWGRACMPSGPNGLSALQDMHDRAIGAGAVEVNWQYTPDQDVAPAPVPAAASQDSLPPQCRHLANKALVDQCLDLAKRPRPQEPETISNYTFCYTDNFVGTAYYGAPFGTTKIEYSAWTQAYSEFLKQKYGYQDPVECGFNKDPVELQKELQTRIGIARSRASLKVVETGWKYK